MQLFDMMTELLEKHEIKPSVPRIRVLEYLSQSCAHPSAEEVYKGIKAKDLRISRATVYNTLNAFADKGLIRALVFEDGEHRYDFKRGNHGHFICTSCGEISDFAAELDSIPTMGPQGYRIDQKDLYFKGVCKKCLESNKKEGLKNA